jgi:hypothetical protein
MKKFTSLFKVAIVFALAFLASVNVNAQVSSYTFAQSSGTYTEITGGTLLATQTGATGATSLDDVIYNLPSSTIPFTFTYNGTGYTGLNISTNGFITFGATAPVTNYLTPISGTTGYAGAISPFGRDMQGGFIGLRKS